MISNRERSYNRKQRGRGTRGEEGRSRQGQKGDKGEGVAQLQLSVKEAGDDGS